MTGFEMGTRGVDVEGTDTLLSVHRTPKDEIIVTPISKRKLAGNSWSETIVTGALLFIALLVAVETTWTLSEMDRFLFIGIGVPASMIVSRFFRSMLYTKVDFQEGGTSEDKNFFNDFSNLGEVVMDGSMFRKSDREIINTYRAALES